MYKHICLATVGLAFGCCFCHCLWRYHILLSVMSTEVRRKRAIQTASDSQMLFYGETHDRTPLVQPLRRRLNRSKILNFMLSYLIILQHSLSFYNSRVQTQDISKDSNLFTSYNGRSESCEFRTSTSSYAIILPAVYELYLFFSVARIFCRWCVNCERGLNLLNGINKK